MRALILAVPFLAILAGCSTTVSEGGVDTGRRNAIIQAEIDRRIGELRYLRGGELLDSLGRLVAYGESATAAIREGARSDDWLTRSSLAWVMGASHDRRYIPTLRTLLDDSSGSVRYEAAASLVELGDEAGFGILVDGLADADIRNRYKCFESLKRATSRDFGYAHDAAPEHRSAAVARWRDWLAGLRASAL